MVNQLFNGECVGLASMDDVLNILEGVVVKLSACAVMSGHDSLEALEVTRKNLVVLGINSSSSSEELKSMISSDSLVNLSLELFLSVLGVLALNLGVQVVELDVAGVNSRARLSLIDGIRTGLNAGDLLRLLEDLIEERLFHGLSQV